MAPIYTVEKEEKKEKLGDDVKKKQKKVSRKRNAKASKQQPPKAPTKKAADRDLDEVKVSELSDKQFKSLSKRERAVLRGD